MQRKAQLAELTRKDFLRALKKLPSDSDPDVWNYWVDWVSNYHIGRKVKNASARTIFNRIQQPSWILWLADAVGVDQPTIRKAARAARHELNQTRTKEMRKILSWTRIAERLPLASTLSRVNSAHINLQRSTSGAARASYARYMKTYELEISPAHHSLQERFERFIRSRATGLRPNLDGVDLRYHDSKRGTIFVEIKPCERSNARYAIRAAIGQLLDYSQHASEPTSLLIVVETKPTKMDQLLAISNGFGIAYPTKGAFEVLWSN